MKCPHCDHENIPGVDDCDQCGHSLTDDIQAATAVERALMSDILGQLNPKSPIVVAPSTALRDVLRLLVDNAIGCALVVDGEKTVGIFSERDAVVKVGSRIDELGSEPISQFMTPDPQALEASAKIAFALQRMDVGGYRHVPIVDPEGKVNGIVSVRDILKYITAKIDE
jgi:CBS domain-containing protein